MNDKLNLLQIEEEAKLRGRIAAGSKDPDEYLALAQLLLSTRRGEEAIVICQTALDLPLTKLQHAKVLSELGWVFYGMARRPEAIQSAQAALRLLPEKDAGAEFLVCQGRSYSVIALCQWASKEADIDSKEAARLAIERYDRLIQEAPNFETIGAVYYDMSQLEGLLGNNKRGIQLCEKYLKCELDNGERTEGLNHLASLLRSENRIPEAETALEQAFSLSTNDNILLSTLYFSQGLLERSSSRPLEARKSFQKAIELRQDYLHDDPHFWGDAYWNLGELNYQQQDYVGALEAFEKILLYHLEADLDHRNALLWMGSCFDLLGDSQQAVECFKKLLNISTASDSERLGAKKGMAWTIGKTLYRRKEYARAAAMFEEVFGYQASDDPERYRSLLWLGHSYLGVQDYQRARNCYKQIMDSLYATDSDKITAEKALSEISHLPAKTIH